MQTFKDYYLLNETPDKSGGNTWAVMDSIAFGIIKNAGLCIKRGTHVNLYNDLYLAFVTKKLNKEQDLKKELSALGVSIIGDVRHAGPIVLTKIKQIPWSVINNVTMGEEAAEILRDEFFDVSGRIWRQKKICSFWNLEKTVQSHLPMLKNIFESYNENIEEFKFEFIERQGKFLTWWEVSGQPAPEITPQQKEQTNKLLRIQHTNPEIKKAVANRGGGANKLASFARSLGFTSPAEYANAFTTGD